MQISTRKEALDAKNKRFFTGRPCARGHVAERYTRNGSCVICQKDSVSKYQAKFTMENLPASEIVTREFPKSQEADFDLFFLVMRKPALRPTAANVAARDLVLSTLRVAANADAAVEARKAQELADARARAGLV